MDTNRFAADKDKRNTVELSYGEYNGEDCIKYIINYKSSYSFIEIYVDEYTGELKSVEPGMAMFSMEPNSISWSDALEKMKSL